MTQFKLTWVSLKAEFFGSADLHKLEFYIYLFSSMIFRK